jgi:cytidylate kinase
MAPERLQKILARAGVASRRRAEELVAAGRVTVNGRPAHLGQRADPNADRIAVDGRPLATPPTARYVAVYKPPGFVSSARTERGRRSVVSLLGREAGEGLWPAGRLDVDSEGLMLLTNDGEWANRVLHPRYGTAREYAVLVADRPSAATLQRLREGVELEDRPARLLAARVARPPPEIDRDATDAGTWLRVRIGEGRKREVRRLFTAVGHPVLRLVRTRIGSVSLARLRAGSWRDLEPGEVAALAGDARTRTPEVEASAPLTVAIDGPAGAGKSTVGYALAQRIGATFIDTGLMYRALTLAALEREIELTNGRALARLADQVRITVERPTPRQTDRLETVRLDGRDVTRTVRRPRVDRAVSTVSAHPEVRHAMLAVQRAAAGRGTTVMVGRDIGTVVLPDATLKVYLTADVAIRAARRAAEMGEPERVDEYLAELRQRDALDSGRSVAPLRIPPGALVIDTGELDVEACVDAIVARLPVPV